MGCVNSHLLTHDDEIAQLSSAALNHHIVKLTSTTYGLLNLDPSPTTPPVPLPRFTLGSVTSRVPEPRPEPNPEIINSWELMHGLDAESFRFSKPILPNCPKLNNENSNPNCPLWDINGFKENVHFSKPISPKVQKTFKEKEDALLCPPGGEGRVVIYTTSLRGVRKTFDACNAVKAAVEGFGVAVCERDVSMDRGFREELRELMKGKGDGLIPPRVFIKGRYIGGAEEVSRLVEEGCFGDLVSGLPRKIAGDVCDGCGDARFLPCFRCNGSCKMAVEGFGRILDVRCDECNENGLVVCPICS